MTKPVGAECTKYPTEFTKFILVGTNWKLLDQFVPSMSCRDGPTAALDNPG